jgi:hypothetical protein
MVVWEEDKPNMFPNVTALFGHEKDLGNEETSDFSSFIFAGKTLISLRKGQKNIEFIGDSDKKKKAIEAPTVIAEPSIIVFQF